MKKFFLFFFFSTFLFSEKIELEKIFKDFYIKSLPFDFKYNGKENAIYYLKKEEKNCLNKFNLKEKKSEKIELEFEPYSFEVFGEDFFILKEEGWYKTKNFKEFDKMCGISGGKFSPSFNYYAYTKDFNLFIFDLNEKKEIKITEDGRKEDFYGEVDWVYGEELDLKDGFLFSKDEKYLVFLEFNEEEMGSFPLINYNGTYPSINYQFYPKAGTKNPSLFLWIYDIKKQKKEILYTIDSENYLAFYDFTQNSKYLVFGLMPRDQKTINFYKIDLKEKEIKKILKEEDKFWINIIQAPFFLNDKNFLWLSEREGFSLPFIYSIDGDLIKFLKRKEMVEKIVDFEEDYLYFISIDSNPLKRKLVKVSLKDGKEEKVFKKEGFLSAKKIENSPYILIYYSKLDTPHIIYLLNKNNGELIEIFNSKTEDFDKIKLPENQFLKINDLNALLLKPKDFVPSKKYPLIVYVYGGPQAQLVSERFGGATYLFHSLLVQEGFIVFYLDNRGSYGRGKNFESAIYKEFGKNELEDQLKGIRFLIDKGFVDEKRIGIWGWSYGGFMVLYSMTHSDIFKAGFSVAPVVDWKYYDTIYTERYLGLPDENKEGYFNSSPINFAKDLKGKLFLVHGSLDDNVHFQNSINFIDKLIKENKKFKFMIYPNRDHSIRDGNVRIHLFEEIFNFFKKEL